ncbi:MAG: glycosyltransferase [Bacteroidota bacterium]|nr:glycosyltransferase [Bacteroidota bacterium]
MKRYVVLEGLFDYETLSKNKTLSAAVTRWLKVFLSEVNYVFVGHEYSRVWPLGNMIFKSKKSKKGFIIGYLNIYVLRKIYLFTSYFFKIYCVLKNSSFQDTLIIHSCLEYKNKLTVQILVAKLFKKLKGINVICIVGDGYEPDGFDAYFFVSYHTYSLAKQKNKFLFEGVVENQNIKKENLSSSKKYSKKIQLMYSGAIDGHVSLKNLIEALQDQKFINKYELIITGICNDNSLTDYFNSFNNVQYLGFLKDEALYEKAHQVDVFINPRRMDFLPNEFNFPSKLLFYMQFDKPIISSLTKGLSPVFLDFLMPIKGDTKTDYVSAINNFNNLTQKEIEILLKKQKALKNNLSKENATNLLLKI